MILIGGLTLQSETIHIVSMHTMCDRVVWLLLNYQQASWVTIITTAKEADMPDVSSSA